MSEKKVYPDISGLLKQYDETRRENIAKPFGEKLLIVERLSRDLAPIRAAREKREAEAKRRREES
jgi:hypothetical protein